MSNNEHNYVVHPIPGLSLWGHLLRSGYCKRCGEPVHPSNDVVYLRRFMGGGTTEGQPSEHFLPERSPDGLVFCKGSRLKVCLEKDFESMPRLSTNVRSAHEQLLIEHGKDDWPKWIAETAVALKKGDIRKAANIVSMCWAPGPGENSSTWTWHDDFGCADLFRHPLVLQHASEIWQFIKDWYEPEVLWWYEKFARSYRWKI